jgi:hypothetical protein|tara:strand:- start:1351 stop:1845 length:495 start_codon:yes stop_codon:yes gene_type:complete
MNIYMVSESPKVVAQSVPDDVWERRLFDAVELVSEGAAHWEGEEAMFICHDPKHSWVKWVKKSKGNWLWTVKYLASLVREVNKRGYSVSDEIGSFSDYINAEYGITPQIRTIPPRCVPKEFKDCEPSIPNVVEAYKGYVRSEVKLHKMGDRHPAWLDEEEVCDE